MTEISAGVLHVDGSADALEVRREFGPVEVGEGFEHLVEVAAETFSVICLHLDDPLCRRLSRFGRFISLGSEQVGGSLSIL